jgi:intracellular sulfur oxidation DsrE/DsrF family protein
MVKSESVGFVRTRLNPAEHRTVRLAAAAKNTNMTAFVCEAALAAANAEVGKLTGDTRAVPKKRRRRRAERPLEAV